MGRHQIAAALLLTLSGCQTMEPGPATFVVNGRQYCSKHRIPLITVRVFEPPYLTTGEYIDQGCIDCERKFPNGLPPKVSLHHTSYYTTPNVYTYCPLC